MYKYPPISRLTHLLYLPLLNSSIHLNYHTILLHLATIMKLTLVTAVLVQAVAISADVEYCSSSAFTLPSNYKCSNREGRTGTYCCHFAAGGPYVDEKLCAHPLDKNDEQVSMSCIDSKGLILCCLEQ